MVFRSKWFSFVIIAALGWLSLSFVKIKMQSNLINKEEGVLEKKITDLEKDNSSIEKDLNYLNHPAFIEREARLKLNYKAEGENVAFIYPDTGQISSSSENFFEQLKQSPNYIKWIYYLLGY